MVNPRGFMGLRKQFLDSQKEIYAAAVKGNHINDTVADIQCRYFKQFPITLAHAQEPTAEQLATIDDTAPDAELTPPSREQEGTDPDGYAHARRVYELQIIEIKMRKAYVYNKDQSSKTTFELGSTNPMAILMGKLTGVSMQKPRQKTPYNLWGPQHCSVMDPIFLEHVRSENTPVKHQAALRSSIYKELFEALPEDEKLQWIDKAREEHQEAMKKAGKMLKAGLSETPEDRQRVIECLPGFVEPILDLIAEHMGWKVTMIAGGPEPADGSRLNIVSIHSGTMTGPIKMNFGRSERTLYLDVIVPTYAKFLKKCYSVQECHDRALPAKSDFAGLAGVEQQEHFELHTIDDGCDRPGERYVKIVDPHQMHVAAGVVSHSKSKTPETVPSPSSASLHASAMKIGPLKGKKKQVTPMAATDKIETSQEITAAVSPIGVCSASSTDDKTSREVTAAIAPISASSAPLTDDSVMTNDLTTSTETSAGGSISVSHGATSRVPTPMISRAPSRVPMPMISRAPSPVNAHAAVMNEAQTTLPANSAGAIGDHGATSHVPTPMISRAPSPNEDQLPSVATSETPALQHEHLNASSCSTTASVNEDVPQGTVELSQPTVSNTGTAMPPAIINDAMSLPPHTPTATAASPPANAPSTNSTSPFTAPNTATLPPILTNTVVAQSPLPSSGSISVLNMTTITALQIRKKSRKRRGTATADSGPSIKRTQASAPDLRTKTSTSNAGKKGAREALQALSCSQLQGGSNSTSSIVTPKECPAWVRNAVNLFESNNLGSEWATLVADWLKFEEAHNFKSMKKLAAKNHPDAISQWIQRARKSTYRPDITNVSKYGSEFNAWWRSIQPEWRIDEGSVMLQRGDGDWDTIRCPGINGLLSVMAGLFFWGVEILGGSSADNKAWMTTLSDILYTIRQL